MASLGEEKALVVPRGRSARGPAALRRRLCGDRGLSKNPTGLKARLQAPGSSGSLVPLVMLAILFVLPLE